MLIKKVEEIDALVGEVVRRGGDSVLLGKLLTLKQLFSNKIDERQSAESDDGIYYAVGALI